MEKQYVTFDASKDLYGLFKGLLEDGKRYELLATQDIVQTHPGFELCEKPMGFVYTILVKNSVVLANSGYFGKPFTDTKSSEFDNLYYWLPELEEGKRYHYLPLSCLSQAQREFFEDQMYVTASSEDKHLCYLHRFAAGKRHWSLQDEVFVPEIDQKVTFNDLFHENSFVEA